MFKYMYKFFIVQNLVARQHCLLNVSHEQNKAKHFKFSSINLSVAAYMTDSPNVYLHVFVVFGDVRYSA